MNWIAGAYNLDSRPLDPGVLGRLADSVRSRAGESCPWANGPIGMICGRYDLAPESLNDGPTLAAPGSSYAICFDGRLDNRQELQARLPSLRHKPLSSLTDVDLVAGAYDEWGTRCFVELIGDFALTLWDQRNRRLICVRDALGIRPLFYYFNGRTLVWASRIRQLLGFDSVPRALDRDYLANYLARLYLPLESTPYTAIKRLQPAHALIIEDGRLHLRRYWQPDESVEINYAHNADYEEHFRQLFRRSVSDRIRSSGPVWCEVSGGLDSSSIACVASSIIRSGDDAHARLNTISWVYDEARHSDERQWIEPVVQRTEATPHYFCCDDHYPLQDLDEAGQQFDEPTWHIVFYSLQKRVAQVLRQTGVRAVLSGQAGDETMVPGYTPIYIADLCRRFRLREAMKECLAWQKHLGFPLATVLLNACVRPLLNRQRTLFDFQSDSERNPVAPWIDAKFAKTMRLRERARNRLVAPPSRAISYQARFERVLTAPVRHGYATEACEYRYPYLDRRLVEFVMALPWTRLFPAGGRPKSLLRRAMIDILPEEVRTRRGGRGPDQAFFLALVKEWPRIEPRLRNLRMADLGLVDPSAFRHALMQARAGAGRGGDLVTALALENWLVGAESPAGIVARPGLALSHAS